MYGTDKDIDRNQFTIISHIDDFRLSHVDLSVVTMIINKLNEGCVYWEFYIEG